MIRSRALGTAAATAALTAGTLVAGAGSASASSAEPQATFQGTENGRVPFPYDCEDHLDQDRYIR